MIMGIDPGKSGAMVLLSPNKTYTSIHPFSKYTTFDLAEVFRDWAPEVTMCYIEKVHSMPKQGVVSSFSFGKNFGWYLGVLDACQIPYDFISPMKWQTFLSCRTGGDKNITKAKAQQLYPSLKITHAIADALLIATYGARQENELLT